ncbi:uncharacterized protein isoform X2 [Rhodnius prolixus]|uniref:uncharacterized protein isoform X2 n=1 Tax=Rhodnius prolixus TaxID=13249 RepID=UPI003D18ABD0
MGFLEELSKEDCAIVDSTVFKEYGYLMCLSGFYPSLKPEKKVLSVIQFILFMFTLLINISALIITVYLADDDETILTQSLHFLIIFGLSFFIFLSFTKSRPQFSRIHRDIGQGGFKYDKDTHIFATSIKDSSKKKKKIIFFALPTFVSVISLVIIVIGPLADYFAGKLGDEIYTKGGISLNLPVPCWTPFGSSTIATFLASSLMEAAGHSVNALALITANISVFYMVEHVSTELKILHLAIKRLKERAQVLYRNRFGNNEMKNEYLTDCYKECLKENIAHHQKILSLNCDMNDVLSLCFSFGYFTGTLMIAISGVLVIFSKDISTILYSSEWYYQDKDSNQLLEMMLLRSQKPLFLYFNNISNLPANLETFSNLMNTAYSYFNLLYAIREEA